MKKFLLIIFSLLPLSLLAQEETFSSLQSRAESGDSAAMLRLYEVYSSGEFGIEPDRERAHNYLMLAVERENPHAFFCLAERYHNDPLQMLEPDIEQTRYWLNRAFEHNHMGAALSLMKKGGLDSYGRLALLLKAVRCETPLLGTEESWLEAQKIIRDVIMNKDIFDNPGAPEYVDAIEWVRGLAESGNVKAMASLGGAYWNVIGDKAKGHFWILKAAENGYLKAAFSLAMEVYFKENSPYRDPVESVKWLVIAAEGGHADAQYWLGASYNPMSREIFPVGEKDIWLSIQWYERAAAQGHAKATFGGGLQIIDYAKNIRNKKESYAIGAHGIRLWEMAVESGDMKAAYMLALAYSLGYGVRTNNKLSNQYMCIAARGGYKDAIDYCRRNKLSY